MFYNPHINSSSCNTCTSCGWQDVFIDNNLSVVAYRAYQQPESVKDYLRDLFVETTRLLCPHCADPIVNINMFHRPPKMLVFSIGSADVTIDKVLKVRDQDTVTKFHLRGVIYLGGFHFTARIIKKDGRVWFHDGQTSAKQCYYEGLLKEFRGNSLNICDDKVALMAIK
jgi:hypothetical protein